MKLIKFVLVLVIFGSTFYGCMRCQNNIIFTSKFVESFLGSYNYTMNDSLGNKVAEGLLRPKIFEDPDISGYFKIDSLYNDKFNSMLGKGGNFFGTLDEKTKKCFINLTPKIADNNIFLRLDVKENELDGTWERSTMRGIIEKGTFKAAKIKDQ
jgi:hypothetical protein